MFHRLLVVLLILTSAAQAQLFQPSGSVALGFNTHHTIADFNLDGRLDLAVAAPSFGTLNIALGNGNGTFTASTGGPTAIDPATGLVAGDFNNDGKTDLAVLSAGLFSEPAGRVLLGSGIGTFSARPALILPNLVRAAAPGDFDQDGNLDIAIVTRLGNGGSVITVLLGNGQGDLAFGFFTSPVTVPVPAFSEVSELQAVDLNGDKSLDLVFAVTHSSGVGLVVGLGDGHGSFSAAATMGNQAPATGSVAQLATADFNGDHNPDVVMFGYLRDRVTLWTNSGGGVLTPQTGSSIPVGSNLYSIAAADFDLNGRMDWAVGRQILLGGTPELYVGLGSGPGTFIFASGSPYAFGGPLPSLETGDFNGDLRTDLLALEGNADAFRILLNASPLSPTLVAQEIQFPQPADRGINDGPLTLSASTMAGLPVVFAGITDSVCTVSKGIATFLTMGDCTILAIQTGNQTYAPAPIVQRTLHIGLNSQTITFAPLEDRTLGTASFTLTATASSGLTVLFAASPASVCTSSGNVATLVGVGQCSITAWQPGNATFPPAAQVTRTFTVKPVVIVGPSIQSISNAASYAGGTLAPNSYGVLFGARLSPDPVVKLRDAEGMLYTLELIFSSDTQLNFIVPGFTPKGAATIVVTTANGTAEFPVTIAATAPGLFSAGGTGQGLAAAQAVILNSDKSVTTLTVGDSSIPFAVGSEVYLVLYGTGIRAHGPNGVFASVAGIPVEVLYAGPQGTYPALDQVNVRVPFTVGGLGTVNIQLIIDGVAANIVTARFQ